MIAGCLTARRAARGMLSLVLAVGAVLASLGFAAGPIARYGAAWVALAGVVLLGLALVRRSGAPARAPRQVAHETGRRPRLTLVTSEHRE